MFTVLELSLALEIWPYKTNVKKLAWLISKNALRLPTLASNPRGQITRGSNLGIRARLHMCDSSHVFVLLVTVLRQIYNRIEHPFYHTNLKYLCVYLNAVEHFVHQFDSGVFLLHLFHLQNHQHLHHLQLTKTRYNNVWNISLLLQR